MTITHEWAQLSPEGCATHDEGMQSNSLIQLLAQIEHTLGKELTEATVRPILSSVLVLAQSKRLQYTQHLERKQRRLDQSASEALAQLTPEQQENILRKVSA